MSTPHPERIGPYGIKRLAGQGSSAQVYEGVRLDSFRRVAIKLLKANIANARNPQPEPAVLAHRRLAALRHPHIVEHLDAGTHKQRYWLAYEWLPGHDLSRYTQTRWLLPSELVIEIGLALAQALKYAHEQGVVHRDLKPSNIRIHLPSRQVKLTDFGVASQANTQATQTGLFIGTPRYMAPEQLLGESASAKGDLYALGVVLYELLSARCPHDADSLRELLQQVTLGQAPQLSSQIAPVSIHLEELIHALIERDPSSRPASAASVAQRLQEIAGNTPADSSPSGPDSAAG